MRTRILSLAACCLIAVVTLVIFPQGTHAQELGNLTDNVLETNGQSYPVGWAQFGPLFTVGGVNADLQLGDDGGTGGCANPLVVGTPNDGCEPMPLGSLSDKIALLERGCCVFVTKVRNAETAGALAVIILNNQDQSEYQQPTMFAAAGDDTSDILISSGLTSRVNGDAIRDLTTSGTARKMTYEEQTIVLDAWASELAGQGAVTQYFALQSWIGSLGNSYTGVKASHSRALWNKITSAGKQFSKGNVAAFTTQMNDLKVLAQNLSDDGEIDPRFADTIIRIADQISDSLGI